MKKQWIEISSKGLIEPDDLRMLGATTKEGDSTKIGYFGSGTKFSLAYMMRTNHSFKIFSGLKEIPISSVVKTYRGEPIKLLVVDGVETQITDRFGADWRAWYIIREFYSNAIDEGGARINLVNMKKKDKEKTKIFIEYSGEFKEVYDNLNKYFSMNRPVAAAMTVKYTGETTRVKILKNIGSNLEAVGRPVTIYRKGIRCNSEEGMESVFDYDLQNVAINESRILKANYTVHCQIAKAILLLEDTGMINLFIRRAAVNATEEENISAHISSHYAVSDKWGDVLDDIMVQPSTARDLMEGAFGMGVLSDSRTRLYIPTYLFQVLERNFPDKIFKQHGSGRDGSLFILIAPTDEQAEVLSEAMMLARASAYSGRTIKTVKFQDKDILASYDKDNIYLSLSLLEHGVLETFSGIIEEYTHIETGYHDETRQLQTYLFNIIARGLAKKQGVIL